MIDKTIPRFWMNKETGQIVETGRCYLPLCPGLVRTESYVKYGSHGKQVKYGFYVNRKNYTHIGALR